jgi:biotin carboxylase
VRRLDSPADVAEGLAAARAAAHAFGLERMLAEGYLDGPDIAVESMVLDGVTHHVCISQSGWRGNLWQAAAPLGATLFPHLTAIGNAVAAANEALGLRWAATSNELRLTTGGPVIVEVNARLGGGPCEDAVLLHAGVDRVMAMLAMLTGAIPELTPIRHDPVAQTVIRATIAGLVQEIAVPEWLLADPVARLELMTAPGAILAQAHDIGWLLLRGGENEEAAHLLERAAMAARQIRVVCSDVEARTFLHSLVS